MLAQEEDEVEEGEGRKCSSSARGLEEGEGKGMQLWCAECHLSGTRGQCTGMWESDPWPPATRCSPMDLFSHHPQSEDLPELSLSYALSTCMYVKRVTALIRSMPIRRGVGIGTGGSFGSVLRYFVLKGKAGDCCF